MNTKIKHSYFLIFILILCSACSTKAVENIPYWKDQYRQCIDKYDLVLIGIVDVARNTDFESGQGNSGYLKYDVSITVETVFKGEVSSELTYFVWYEGNKNKLHEISGRSLFCLSENSDGSIQDVDGFGRLPLNKELEYFMKKNIQAFR